MSRTTLTASSPSRDIYSEQHLSDAFAEALGRVVAEKQKEFDAVIALRDAQFRAVEAELRQSFSEQIKYMSELVEQTCSRVKDGADGKNGIDGTNGKDVDMDIVGDVIEKSVSTYVKFELDAWPKPQNGKDGISGPAGEQGPQGERGERGELGERGLTGEQGLFGLTGEKGKDGEHGRDGRDGLPGVSGAQGEKGIDGKNGIDGKDGAGFDDWSVNYDGKRTMTITCGSGERTKSRVMILPFPMFQGKWTVGKKFDQGDEVSHGGNTYRALRATLEKPGQSEDWIIATNRGRDGRDGKNGEAGPQGPQGPRGMDLTQLGQDGKKW